jgi:hypothetical protein
MDSPAADCRHGRIDEFDTLYGRRGWRCLDCEAAGPTMIGAVFETASGRPVGLRGFCVCGSGGMWPAMATGAEVGDWLSGHAGCALPEPAREEADRYRAAILEALGHFPRTIATGEYPDSIAARANAARDVLRKAVGHVG